MPLTLNIIVYVLLVGIFTCVVMVIVSIAQSAVTLRNMPKLSLQPVLDTQELALYGDLLTIADKLKLPLLTKLSLGCIVQIEKSWDKKAWLKELGGECLDFVLCEPRTMRPVLVIFPSSRTISLERKRAITARALNDLNIPFLEVGSYNMLGLEKAIDEKLPIRRISGRGESSGQPGSQFAQAGEAGEQVG